MDPNEAMDKYCYYASSSVWGSTGSVIWFATSDSIEGPYEYEDSILYSGFNRLLNNGKFYSRVNSNHYTFTNIGDLFKAGVYTKKILKMPLGSEMTALTMTAFTQTV